MGTLLRSPTTFEGAYAPLLGIDTPETKKPGYSVGCWGLEASEFAKSTLLGQRVAFVTDPSQGMYLTASAGLICSSQVTDP